MSSSDASGFLSVLLILGSIASWLGSGIVAWNWVEPDNFGGAILFLIAWGIMGKIFDMILALVLTGIANMME